MSAKLTVIQGVPRKAISSIAGENKGEQAMECVSTVYPEKSPGSEPAHLGPPCAERAERTLMPMPVTSATDRSFPDSGANSQSAHAIRKREGRRDRKLKHLNSLASVGRSRRPQHEALRSHVAEIR